jgi:hypothetical protein
MESGWHWTCNEQKWSRSPNRIDGSFDRQSRLGENKYRRTSATTFLRCGAFAVTLPVRSELRDPMVCSGFSLPTHVHRKTSTGMRLSHSASNMNRHTKRPPPKGPHAGAAVRGVPEVSSTKARTTVTTSIRRRSPHRCRYSVVIFNACAITSIYFSPEPVLKSTTLSVGFRKPSRSNR